MGNLAYRAENEVTELHDGKIVSMSPSPAVSHNIATGNIFNIFKNYLKGKKCKAFVDGVDVNLTEKDRVIPDVTVVCNPEIIRESHNLFVRYNRNGGENCEV